MPDRLLLEDGTSFVLLEDGTSKILLETQPVEPSFIASVTVVYTPTVEYTIRPIDLPFIASVAVARPPLFTGNGTYTFDTSSTWTCPEGLYEVKIATTGGGGGGGQANPGTGSGGGGGGAYAANDRMPVTPGNTYTVTVGASGTVQGGNGGDSTFTGDSSTTVTAQGGRGATNASAGAGGAAGSSTGTVTFSGGSGGSGVVAVNTGGAGGGEAGGPTGAGNPGGNSVGGDNNGKAGGTGGGTGGDGGAGGFSSGFPSAGLAPGGGGGGRGSADGTASTAVGAPGRLTITVFPTINVPFISSTTALYGPLLTTDILPSFISSVTVVYTPDLQFQVSPSFIASTTVVYAPTIQGDFVEVPFIASTSTVFAIVAVYTETTGPGNGGETTPLQLAPTGAPETATLAAALSSGATSVSLSSDGGLPVTGNFVLTVDNESFVATKTSSGTYRIVQRPVSNTSAAAHTAGATATWTDTYDMAVLSASQIGATIDYTVDGASHEAWLMAFDSSQAYLGSDRYATAVSELVGVFPAGTGSLGTNKLDSSQPVAEQAPAGVTDDCPVGITQPSKLLVDIEAGDVALLRYVNTEAGILTLGPRSSSIQSWYAFMRVDGTNNDVTDSDPTANVVDGTKDAEFFNDVFATATLPGTDRFFTYGPPHYSDKGWPIAALAIRQGTRRVPRWDSPDWHQFSYVYSGFSDDATYCQVLINRNGFNIADPVPSVSLPGPDDITGPNATWDDPTYYTSIAWGVFIFKPNARTILIGPPFNPPPPTDPQPPSDTIIPVVPPQPGGGGTVTPPVSEPEGGHGGDIYPPVVPPTGERFWVALV